MPDDLPRARPDRTSLGWFLLLSAVINGAVVVSGYWIKLAKPAVKQDTVIELVDIDTNDVEKLGNPNAPDEMPPLEPEPTPLPLPPAEDEPTPPPLDTPPEFEIPEPMPTPMPTPAPSATPRSEATPRPTPRPQPHIEGPKELHVKTPRESNHNPNAAPTPGLARGSATGAPNGTGHGGPRAGTLIRSPKPPYPPQALQLGIRGDVRVQFTVSNGEIVDAKAVSGPPMLSSAVIRWTKANWKFAPGTNGTFTLPVTFQIR